MATGKEEKTLLVCSKGQRFPFFHFRPTCVFVCGCGASSSLAKKNSLFLLQRYTAYYIQATFYFFVFFLLLQLVGMLCISKQAGKARATFSCFLTNILRRQQQKHPFLVCRQHKNIYRLLLL